MSDQEIKHRVEFIDVAKTLAIIAVIAGRTAIRFLGLGAGSQLIFALAFTFHLPVFFVTSGYFLHVDRRYELPKEVRALVIPYAVSSILIITFVSA
uniref:acyltransferase family protein n=1 Tax=Collinsella aerofaciens TaxID=74426 RepID=UPI00359C9B99